MAEDKRILVAILAANAGGFSRLMSDDERATMDTLTAYRKVFRELISEHDGRVVDADSDIVFADFENVVKAVESAVEIHGHE